MGLFDTGYDLGSGLSNVGSTESFGAVDPFATATPDYGTSAPSSSLDFGSTSSWVDLLQGSVSKGLDYFMAKDAMITKAELMPKSYPQSYIRGADGRLYQSNGMPVSMAQSQMNGNNTLLLLIAGAVGLVLLGRG